MNSKIIPNCFTHISCFVLIMLLVMQLIIGCDYARMKDDEAVDTFQSTLPASPPHTIPIDDGIEKLRTADPRTLENPLSVSPESVAQGKEAYGYYCIHCHGPKAEGHGTVGQSFAPLPTNLKKISVQSQSDGELFAKISLGYKRHPPLAYTVDEKNRWAIINYLRFLSTVESEVR